MDSRTTLDHVLFQLTPTRTRCDLVIYGGGLSEKLASGLLQPFLSHLKTAQQQISKGGYSISLTPPPNASYWFTKATLQRFVRFVSTPEVLERFVTIEKELEQIESSVQSNDIVDAQGGNGSLQRSSSGDFVEEDNSKARLQRALETRKAVLRKEQAMAYARALVTGFELDSINDLISFADAFGASRLREACLNFMELCKKKNQDRMWMDEIAAMQASRLELPFHGTSGIVLTSEENYGNNGKINGSVDASDSSHGSVDLNQDSGSGHVSMPWSNHYPQYMNNFQGPMYSQMLPYQGYMYPLPPYFPGNVQWPPKGDNWEPEDRKKHKSLSRKKKSSHGRGHETPDSTEPSDSGSETQSDGNSYNSATEKKHRKKSSRKVIIRNINYITSDKDSKKEILSDGEDKSTSRHKKSHGSTVNESNDGNGEGTKGNEPWGAFQSILLQEKDLDGFESEQRSSAVNLEIEGKGNQHSISSDSFIAVTRGSSTREEFHRGSFEAGNNLRPVRIKTDATLEESVLSQRDEGSENFPQATFTDHSAESLMIKGQKEGDWFISNRASDGDYDSSFRGDHSRFEESKKSLPVDDSFFIQNRSFVEDQSEPTLRRERSMAADIVVAAESENGNNKSNDKSEAITAHEPEDLCMVLERDSATDNAMSSWTRDMDYENDPLSTQPKPASTVKPTDEKAGPARKLPGKETKTKTSNATLGRSKTEQTTRHIKPLPAGKSSIPRSKNKEEETRKRLEELAIQRQKRIAERSAAASKRLPVKKTPTAKTEDPKIQPAGQANKKAVFRSSTIERLATARVTPKPESVQSKTTQPKKATPKANSSSHKSNVADQKRTARTDAPQKKEMKAAQKAVAEPNSIDEFQDIKELHSIASTEKKEVKNGPQMETKEENSSIHNDETSTESAREIRVRSENVTWAEKCEIIQIATPPQEEIMAEAVHSRKKWNTEETSPKAVKGFRKLLMFGRKSRSSAVSMA